MESIRPFYKTLLGEKTFQFSPAEWMTIHRRLFEGVFDHAGKSEPITLRKKLHNRGFLFQDYVTIMCLLQNNVEYVCSEYLEDIDVFYADGTFEFIQVKYYPKTSPKMKEISTDLYYQYLRLRMLQSTLTAVPRLYIHRNSSLQIYSIILALCIA